MTNEDLAQARWRTSSASSGNGQCVEVAFAKQWLMRDSKHPEGGALAFAPDEWDAFVGRVEDGEFNRSV